MATLIEPVQPLFFSTWLFAILKEVFSLLPPGIFYTFRPQ